MPAWCWELLEPYLRRNLVNHGVERPTRRQLLEEFTRVWPEFTATLGVQEPFAGTIRFKWLVRLSSDPMGPFLDDPMAYLHDRYGGRESQSNPPPGPPLVYTKELKTDGQTRPAR